METGMFWGGWEHLVEIFTLSADNKLFFEPNALCVLLPFHGGGLKQTWEIRKHMYI